KNYSSKSFSKKNFSVHHCAPFYMKGLGKKDIQTFCILKTENVLKKWPLNILMIIYSLFKK
ncbi:MAG: hypothetical protein ABIQ07_09985, partial [Ginsengibacter sp.]